jgi:hypothetical protein
LDGGNLETVQNFWALMGVRTHDWTAQTQAWDPISLTWNLQKNFFELLEEYF